jgi:RNA polymerase sigma-70 factor (ECF subfamily)
MGNNREQWGTEALVMSGDTRDSHAQCEDDDAIRRCQQGEIASLGALVARYQVPAVRLAYLLTGDHDLANDIAQESFLLAYRGIKRFRLGEPFAPWFFRIVTNAARQQQRFARRRREISLDSLDARAPDDSAVHTLGVVAEVARAPFQAQRADPAEQVEGAEAQAALLTLLDGLPQKQREAMALRYYMGYSDQQIAQMLGCRLGTVQQRLHAGRASLRQAILRRSPWLLSSLSTRSTDEHQEAQRHVTEQPRRI